MWNKIRVLGGLMLLGGMSVWFVSGMSSADSTTPGTVNDPLITKSYVDMKVEELRDDLEDLLDGFEPSEDDPEEVTVITESVDMDEIEDYIDEQIEAQFEDLDMRDLFRDDDGEDVVTEGTESSSMVFEVVRASSGQQLICGASAEVILRAGTATVIAGENGDGLANLTTGEDLAGGVEVPANHHLLVSRDDGRGVLVTQEAGFTYILVKGDYRLE